MQLLRKSEAPSIVCRIAKCRGHAAGILLGERMFSWVSLRSVVHTSIFTVFLATAVHARTWTDIKGRNLEAEMVSVEGTIAIVKRSDGKEARLQLAALSARDKEFVAKWTQQSKLTAKEPAKTVVATAAAISSSPAKPSTPAPTAAATEEPYYPEDKPPIFNPYPNNDKNPWLVKNFGPVGIGINLIRPGMTMQINNVEKGSPAETTGKLEKGQIIESINGKVLKEIDPRVILGDIITDAEATDGKVVLKVQGVGDVTVKIPVMGKYSDTWPLNCPKSDKIVRNLADLLAKDAQPKWGSVLFLLSTGEEKDLDVVRKWMKDIKTVGPLNWHKGFLGPSLCEYYLRTGDQTVLPVIKQMTEELRVNMYSGGWGTRDKPAAFTYSTGSGQVHAGGVHCMVFLLTAKLCGVDVDDYMFNEAFAQFYRFAGHGNVAYGNGLPEAGFRDNGKTSGLALALEAAALLSPEGESSVYAKARDNSAMKAFYATNWFHAAHTGGGLGEIWHHSAVSQMREKRPLQYRSYLDTRRWVMELSRRFDGSIGIGGMVDRYDVSATEHDSMTWGTYFALTYTYPRKHLQLFGAPRSKWAKNVSLPCPWGNAADDIFHSIEPIPGGSLTLQDLMNEKVEIDGSAAVSARLNDPGLTDETLLKYIHHPEYGLRSAAMNQVTKRSRADLVLPLLKSSDPRLRQAGLLALTGMSKGIPLPAEQITPEIREQVVKILNDPDESWWTAYHAIESMARFDPKLIGQHRDRLLQFLTYNCTWIQTAAACTLAKIATDPDHYKVVLPVIVDKAASFRVDEASRTASRAIADAMKSASPEVMSFAGPVIKKTYTDIPAVISEPYTGAIFGGGAQTIRSRIGEIVQLLPGGQDFVQRMPKTTLASAISGKDSDMYTYSGTFAPNKEAVGTWAWAVWPAPSKPEEIDACIQAYIKLQKQKGEDPTKRKDSKDTLQILDGGKVAKSKFYSGYIWSGDTLIGINSSQAVKMKVRTIDGYDFLAVECGGFANSPDSEEILRPKDWHCGYHVYVRQPK